MSNAAASRAASPDFPTGYTAYHTYSEMVADVDSVVSAHPNIARKFSIGKSYEGLDLWAVKVSDNVNVDENEPEVLFDANIHAREHITAEMNLYILHLLTDNYGKDTQVTQLVNSREIYLVMHAQPRRRDVRHQRREVPQVAQESSAKPRLAVHRHRPQPQLRLVLGML